MAAVLPVYVFVASIHPGSKNKYTAAVRTRASATTAAATHTLHTNSVYIIVPIVC